MSNWQLNTPVAFIIFNRPDTTARVFAEIANAKPPKLLVIADGPRHDRPGEAEKCSATRAIIEGVDWPCELLTNYSDSNMGCKNRVASGLDWVFEQVPEAIILEDDCLPDPSFFRFCEELLERYRDDERIMLISGTSFYTPPDTESSYYFSRYPHIWGWASWRRVWKHYDVDMISLPTLSANNSFQNSFSTKREFIYWTRVLNSVYLNQVNTWDAQVTFLAFSSSRYSIYPFQNLISNIGFRDDATHTKSNSRCANLAKNPVQFPLNHPSFIFPDIAAEKTRKNMENIGSTLPKKIIQSLLRKIGIL